MKAFAITTLLACVAAVTLSAQNQAAPTKLTLASAMLRSHDGIQRNLVEAAEKMPDEHYGFKPTPEMRPFGQLVAHIALSRFGTCAALTGQKNPHAGEKDDQPLTKARAVTLLKDAGAYCAEAFKGITEETVSQFVTAGPANTEVARGIFLSGESSHAYQTYGTMAVYLRLKGIVPPSTERTQQRKTQ